MKHSSLLPVVAIGLTGVLTLSSCSNKTYLPTLSPEETGLNVVKITDESKNTVLGVHLYGGSDSRAPFKLIGNNKKDNVWWGTARSLSLSPYGDEIAYMTKVKDQQNIMVRSAFGSNAATQRTFRNVGDFSWGDDDNLYFIDINDNQNKICVIDAHAGSFMRQLTSNNADFDPILTADKKKVFFTRYDSNTGPAIWSYDLGNGQLTNCAPGFHPVPVSKNGDEFICVRNSNSGNSEIWRVNYVNGRETIILSDKERSYTHPAISPDGEWMLVVGNATSSIDKKKNLDIFAVKTDGTSFVQLTYHPADDCMPQWSADGQSIYFISDRANKDKSFNVWRMPFKLKSSYNSSYTNPVREEVQQVQQTTQVSPTTNNLSNTPSATKSILKSNKKR